MNKCQNRGCEFINVSPLKSDADQGLEAQWLPISPNTDTALMLGLAYCLWQEGACDHAYLEKYCTGFERFLPYLTGQEDGVAKNAYWAQAITWLPEGVNSDLAP